MKKVFVIILCLICLTGCSIDKLFNEEKGSKEEQIEKKEEITEEKKKSDIDYGIFNDYYDLALKKVESMTIEEKVGQMIFSRMPSKDVESVIKNYHVGGFIMFGVDFKNKTKNQVINEIKSYQQASSIPLLIGVDEEGGTVVRISSNSNLYPNRFESPQNIYRKYGLDGIIKDTEEKSKLLKDLGLNVNLAPVADLSTNPNDFIYNRTLGKDAKETSEYIKIVVNIYNKNNMGCCLKHFPGYGNNVDTHTGIAIDERDYNTFVENDFLPFKAGIEEGVPSILVSHNIVNSMDSDKPASLSKNVHEILRKDLGFTGIIMTDDLAMDAITLYSDNPYVEAVTAGNDLLITTDYKKTYESILNAVKDKNIDEKIINDSVTRIIAWKYKMGLLEE